MKTLLSHFHFYIKSLQSLIEEGRLSLEDSVLIVNGGDNDKDVFQNLGFEDVTIANLDDRMLGNENIYTPYKWSYQNTESLEFEDNSYDLVVVHSGLHHLRCPHKGVNEMYRVARKGILGFEPHDCLYTRAGAKMGVGQEYETAAVHGNDCKWGGVENTEIPNLVYRFSAREIKKWIQVNRPVGEHYYQFFYESRTGGVANRLKSLNNPLLKFVGTYLCGALSALGKISPQLANNMAFYVEKTPPETFPWITKEGDSYALNKEVLKKIYN